MSDTQKIPDPGSNQVAEVVKLDTTKKRKVDSKKRKWKEEQERRIKNVQIGNSYGIQIKYGTTRPK